ncbi:Carnitine O-palmitoyltransferase 1, liver isoform [Hypsibius exemplaris]|uniref:carnitine O-palmitoyltransferase n=1 Tax=Hypsibius exemplaris TaxID=2072580 RepID=A0A1W0X4Q7_HYPEX|nr:Carnitine O-palmitoyltransferase 1, liver isoform [Hypsibius exemplaris]
MAEAKLAVAFSFNVSHEGLRVDYDKELVRELMHTAKRSWRYRFIRFWNNIKNVVFPFTVPSLMALIVLTSALTVTDYWDPTFGFARKLTAFLPWRYLNPREALIASSLTISTTTWATFIFFVRWITQLLLNYRGVLYERRGRYSWKTKAWFMAVKLLQGSKKPQLYDYQGMMPILPLPSLKETMRRYLRSVRPLLDDSNYDRMTALATDFQKGVGRKFQRYLYFKHMISSNYVSDWWEEYVYLRSRSPIMINSNFYAMDALLFRGTRIQAARAANLTHALLTFRRMIHRQDVTPLLLDKTIPLCSWQYHRTFDTCRVPGIETDKVVHFHNSSHIVVLSKGRFYKVPTHGRGRLLNPKELELQFERILQDNSTPQPGEDLLAALTAGERKAWAEVRNMYFARGTNRLSLETIERAAFFVALDDEEFSYDENDSNKLDDYCQWLLHGNGKNRWYDKSFTMVVLKNGKSGLNVEHSWADAPVVGHAWEWAITEDLGFMGYEADGHTKGVVELSPTPPQRLSWEISEECMRAIDTSYTLAKSLCEDVDLRVLMFKDYGKGFMKTCKVSPDAYIQLALQLAYRRDAGKFNLTYEASMTRLFREGRTETVRPCTVESCAFVTAMLDESVTNLERQRLLRVSCDVHQTAYLDCMSGKGIDRHLFCLYVVSRYLEIESPFLKEVLSEPWRLSTSQTPQTQTGRTDVSKHPEQISPGGGFGPVADDGYGVSYIISGEDIIFFHISSKLSSPETDSNRFRDRIHQALLDIKAIFSA